MFPQINKVETGKKLRTIMEGRKLTVEEVKKYLGLSCVQTIYHWFEGITIPSTDNLYALSELFKIPIDKMLCGNRTWKGSCDVHSCRCCGRNKPRCEEIIDDNNLALYISNSMTSDCFCNRIKLYYELINKGFGGRHTET